MAGVDEVNMEILQHDVPFDALREQIRRQRDLVLDLDRMVDQRRADLDAAILERDRAAKHLQQLLEWVAATTVAA